MTADTQREQDLHWMARALALAQETSALASPNPQVGCVLVRDGRMLGEGAHRYAERDHAEIVALKQAASAAHTVQGATAYVTLEPCSHQGRTGPCADALVQAGVTRCVIATQDPNPQISGRGLAKLRGAGVEITLGPLEEQVRALNDAFAWSIQHHRPFVTLKTALSVDGFLAPAPGLRRTTNPHWLTGSAARAEVQRVRHASDAILTGIGTVLADNPAMTDRTGLPRRRPLLRIVVDRQLRTPLACQLVQSAQANLLIICSQDADGSRRTALQRTGVEVQPLAGEVMLPALMEELQRRQLLSVLLEAGPGLNGAMLRANLADRAILFYSETELGPGSVPFAEGAESPFLLEQRLTRVQRTTFPHDATTDACVRGLLHDPWAGCPHQPF